MPMNFQEQDAIPRRINLYWHDTNVTGAILDNCLSSLYRFHSTESWSIYLWTAEKLPINMPLPINWDLLGHEHRSDYVRLWTLAYEGGVWSDAYMLHAQPLDTIFNFLLSGVHAFSPPPPYDLVPADSIENWLLACSPGDAFMYAWFQSFSDRVSTCPTTLSYYSMHEISMQLRKEFPGHPIYLHDSCLGPYEGWCQTFREPLLYGFANAWALAYGATKTTKLNKYSRNVAELWPIIASIYLVAFAFLIFLIQKLTCPS